MSLEVNIRNLIEQKTTRMKPTDLSHLSESISCRYRHKSGQGNRLVTQDDEVLAYAAVRMPATMGAVASVLEWTVSCAPTFNPKSMLDVGAGTGAASIMASEFFDLNSIVCLEREPAMMKLGQELMRASAVDVLKKARWQKYDMVTDEMSPLADLVVVAYALNELTERTRLDVVKKLWNATNDVLVLIEPGTPEGYRQIIRARDELSKFGAYMVAPCPHSWECPMIGNDWCHFSCRIARGKTHRRIKRAELSYEDEKFSYLVVSRRPYTPVKGRILRHPTIGRGRIALTVCMLNGIREITVSKKDGEHYKSARKLSWGAAFD